MQISKEQIAKARVLVVGDVMLDRYWYGAVDRISPEAPVPVVRVTREEERAGGAANVAYNAVSLGAHASLLTVVGDDDASHHLEELVAKTGTLCGTLDQAGNIRNDKAAVGVHPHHAQVGMQSGKRIISHFRRC